MKKSDAARLLYEIDRLNRCLVDAGSPVKIDASIDAGTGTADGSEALTLSFLVNSTPAVAHIQALE